MKDTQRFAYGVPLRGVSTFRIHSVRKRLLILEGLILLALTVVFTSLLKSVAKDSSWIQLSFIVYPRNEGKTNEIGKTTNVLLEKHSIALLLNNVTVDHVINVKNRTLNNGRGLRERASIETITTTRNDEIQRLNQERMLSFSPLKTGTPSLNDTVLGTFGLYSFNVTLLTSSTLNKTLYAGQLVEEERFLNLVEAESLRTFLKDLQGVTVSIHHLIMGSLYPLFLSQIILIIHVIRLFTKITTSKTTSLTTSLLHSTPQRLPSKVPLGLVGALCTVSSILVSISLILWYYRYLPDTCAIFYGIVKYFEGVTMDEIQHNSRLCLLRGYFYALLGAVVLVLCAVTTLYSVTCKCKDHVGARSDSEPLPGFPAT